MFTGLIEQIGTISVLRSRGGGKEIAISWPGLDKNEFTLGESISVSGACLTVERAEDGRFWAAVMPQTANATTLGQARVGQHVNLERSLKVGDRMGGHFVLGHVDRVVGVKSVLPAGESRLLEVEIPAEYRKYIVSRGSVCLDGVSLTIAEIKKDSFMVSLVKETQERTTLGEMKAGGRLNLEVDILAKHIASLLEAKEAEIEKSSVLEELLSGSEPE